MKHAPVDNPNLPITRQPLLIAISLTALALTAAAGYALAAPNSALALIWDFTGSDTGDTLGYAVAAAGDVNGDGFADVLIGAPKDTRAVSREGVAYLFSGGPGGLSAGWAAGSSEKGANFGSAVSSAGDVNGDGYADVIVGAPDYKNDKTQAGAAFVYFGSAAGLSATPNWAYVSPQGAAHLGISVSSAGDVNNDGYADVIIGASDFLSDTTLLGAALLFLGSETGPAGTPHQILLGEQANARFGFAVSSAGDVNGDGFVDVIIGAPQFDHAAEDTGAAFLFFGSGCGLVQPAGWWVAGSQPGARLGASVAAGDVNGDGYTDVIVGAPQNTVNQSQEGSVLVFYGSAAGPAATPGWQADSGQSLSGFGGAVSAGDVNQDGFDDVLVGASRYTNDQNEEGAVFFYFGSAAGLSPTPGWRAEGNKSETEFGFAVAAAGDINRDGYADVLIGAPQYRIETDIRGRAYAYLGAASAASQPDYSVFLPLLLKN